MDMPDIFWAAVQMPIFFFLSGSFYSVKMTWGGQLKSDAYKLLLPALLFSLTSLCILFAQGRINSYNPIKLMHAGMDASIVWFLIALYFYRAVSHPFVKKEKSWIVLLIASIVYVPGFWLYGNHMSWIFPLFPTGHAFCFMLSFALGLQFGKPLMNFVQNEPLKSPKKLCVITLSIAYIVFAQTYNWKNFFIPIPYLAYSIPYNLSFIFLGLQLCYYLQHLGAFIKPIEYVGSNSIVFYLTHWPLWIHVFKPLGWNPYMVFVIIVLLEFPLIYLFTNYLPWMIGKNKNRLK